MKATRQILAAALLSCGLFSASNTARAVQTWAQTYGSQSTSPIPGDPSYGAGTDIPRGIAKMPDGGFVVAGLVDLPKFGSGHTGYNACGALIRYAPDGSIVWQKLLKGNNDYTDGTGVHEFWSHIQDMKTDAAGNIYICGSQAGDYSVNYQPRVAKLNAAGDILWQNGMVGAAWPQPNQQPDIVTGLLEFGGMDITADGGIVAVTGIYAPGNTHRMPAVVKFNAGGSVAFLSALDNSTQYLDATAVCQSSDGTAYYVIIGWHPAGSCTVLKLDLSGNKVAEKVFLSDAVRWETPARIMATPDGGCVIMSNQNSSIGYPDGGVVLRKLSSSLDNQFEKVIIRQRSFNPQLGYLQAFSLAPTNDGGYLIGGGDRGGGWDVTLVKFSSAGALVSASMIGGPAADADPASGGCSAIQLADGGYAFVSSTFSYVGSDTAKPDLWVVKTDANRQVAGFTGTQSDHSVSPTAGNGDDDPYYIQVDNTFPGAPSSEFTRISPDAVRPMDSNNPSWGNFLAFVTQNLATQTPPDAPLITIQALQLPPEIAVEQPVGTNINTGGTAAFGSANVGASTSLTFTIKNTGLGDLQLSGTPKVGVGGTDATMFSVTTQPNSPVAATNGSTTFVVQFSPTSAGAKTAALSILNNDSDESPFVINVTGTGLSVPEIAIEQPAGTNIATGGSKSFGSVTTGASESLTFTIKNIGTADLTLTGTPKVSVSGTDAALFTVTTQPTSPVIASGNSTFTVQFAPVSSGAKTAALSITNNDSDENPFVINVTGNGVSTNANLASLTTSAGSLPFTSDTLSYSLSVLNAVTNITLTPAVADSSATVKVNNTTVASGNASAPISLAVGNNTINTVVTAQDGTTTKTYTLTVSRGSGANTKSQITSPANGSALVSTSLPLQWNAGVGVTQRVLWVGTSVGGYDLYAAIEAGSGRTISNLPTDKKIYVTLYSLINGVYLPNYYYFNPLPSAKAALVSPATGSTLTSSTLNLSWSAGVGVSRYYVYVGSSPGGYDLAAVDAGTATSRSFTVPQDGGPVYVTLWSLINGAFQSNGYWFTTALPVSGNRAAILTSPANASTLTTATMNLTWDAGAGTTSYALWVGSTPNGYDLYAGLEGTNRSKTVNVPGDGRRIYVTLHSLIGAGYQSNAYYFTAPTLPDGGAAQVTAPAIGSTLGGSSMSLTWSSAAGASQYYLFVGRSPGASDLYAGSQGTLLSKTVTGIPVDGSPVYVTLYSFINNAWKTNSAWFYSSNTASGNRRALVTSPANGSDLPGTNVTVAWSGGVGVTSYVLWIGSSPGGYDLWSSAETSSTSSRSVTLPSDGRKLYVTLYSFVGGAWQPASYLSNAANVAVTKGTITSPVPGSVLGGTSATFNWSASNSATAYALWVGRAPGGYDVYAGAEGTNLSRTVNTLPTDGGPVYVTLWSLIKGAWQSTEAIFQSAAP